MIIIAALFTIVLTIALSGSLFIMYQQMIDNLDQKSEIKNLQLWISQMIVEDGEKDKDLRHLAAKVLALESSEAGLVDPVALDWNSILNTPLADHEELNKEWYDNAELF